VEPLSSSSHWQMEPLMPNPHYRPSASKPVAKSPARKPTARQRTGGGGHSVRNQPRDAEGKWTKIGKGFTKFRKKVKKFKRSLSPHYQARRVHQTQRYYQKQDMQLYYGVAPTAAKPKRRGTTRRKTTPRTVRKPPLWRRVLGF
jgi:hypothetical protein